MQKNLIETVPFLLDHSAEVHISGCSKGCAHPKTAALTIVGTAEGVGLVLNGRACDDVVAIARHQDVQSLFSKLDIHHRKTGRPDESALMFLRRLAHGDLKSFFKGTL
ncbi:sulfite reductase beta subunit-like hemoprotein [Agrobacterium vitis]|nr:sulfite reductase beta subunit-like hemoprotein [Agrobacterium vitis]MBE1440458.1 sulfite reductase beta subunit-like hemoprotein [Agrobacterium vitis]